jgi:mitochondrial fission protein ELM1
MLVGGPTVPFVFDDRVSERLCRLATDITGAGGTPFVSTSRRTPRAVVHALRTGLPRGAQLFEWAPAPGDNPYLALLGLADGFIVTGDSVSMMAEVVRMRRPLAILDLPLGRLGTLDQWRRTLTRQLFAAKLGRRLVTAAHRARLVEATRDFRAFHRMLLERGLAVRAGEPLSPPRGAVPDDLPAVVARIRALTGATVDRSSG